MALSPPRLAKRISALSFIFVLFGLVMLFSASGLLGIQRHDSEFYFLIQQGTCAAIGLVLLVVLSRLDYHLWEKLAYPVIFCQLLLLVITFIPAYSHSANGVSRWIRLGGFTFQPSELAKISFAIYVAHLISLRQKDCLPLRWGLLLCLPLGVCLFLIFRQPDLGSTILLTSTCLAVLFIAGTRPALLLGFVGVGTLLFALSTWNSAYRQRRLVAFLNPWADPQGAGFQSIQSYLSFHSGKLTGLGLGNGTSKLFYLPEVHTDFIFALIGEELGFVGATLLLLAFAYLGYLLFKVVSLAGDSFGRYLAFGIALSLVLQVAVNMGGVTGLLPVKGLPLPFISWGRSSLIVNLAMIGILLNVVRQSEIIRASPLDGGETNWKEKPSSLPAEELEATSFPPLPSPKS